MGQRAAIYARVSTSDQSCDRQVADLTTFAERGGYEVIDIFRETASGTKASRAARNRIMRLAQAREINSILVTELSRWGRSTQDLLETLDQFCRLEGVRCGHERHDIRTRHTARTHDRHDVGRGRAVRARSPQRTGQIRACRCPRARQEAWTPTRPTTEIR